LTTQIEVAPAAPISRAIVGRAVLVSEMSTVEMETGTSTASRAGRLTRRASAQAVAGVASGTVTVMSWNSISTQAPSRGKDFDHGDHRDRLHGAATPGTPVTIRRLKLYLTLRYGENG
jgi:hypothetical protein